MQDDAERATAYLAELVAVRLLRRGWPVAQTARATGVPRDVLRGHCQRLAGFEGTAAEFVGPAPWTIDREAAAFRAARGCRSD